MGEGLKRVAKQFGGLTVTSGGKTARYDGDGKRIDGPKERPIIMRDWEVRALANGRKTQTRRPAKAINGCFSAEFPCYPLDEIHMDGPDAVFLFQTQADDTGKQRFRCPYGVPGDRLPVREAFWAKHDTDCDDYRSWSCGPCLDVGEEFHPGIQYCASPESENPPDGASPRGICAPGDWWEAPPEGWDGRSDYRGRGQWEFHSWPKGYFSKHPSIHMPRWASRFILDITSIRVERLQSISEADCWAEGIEEADGMFLAGELADMANRIGCCIEDAKPMFACLWESEYGKKPGMSWDDNPWVWRVEHKTCENGGKP